MATILVIDDSTSILVLLEQMLSQAGHQVLTASEGKQGLATLRNKQVDLIITDIYMPERDGIEVIQETPGIQPGVRVIAMSSKPSEENLFSIARALGASSTLRKPFSRDQLFEAVAAALDPQSAQRDSGQKGPAADRGRTIELVNPEDGDKKHTNP